ISSEPIRLLWPVACTRSSAMSNVLPLSGAAQSCGTGTVAHSKARFCGGDCWRRMPAATSGHGFQAAGPPDGRAGGGAVDPLVAPELGETQREVGVQAAETRTAIAARTGASTLRRRTTDPLLPRNMDSLSLRSHPAGQHVGHVDPYRPFELLVGARRGF